MSLETQSYSPVFLFPDKPHREVHVRSIDEETVPTIIASKDNTSVLPDNFAGGIFSDIHKATAFLQENEFPGTPNIQSIGPIENLDERTTIIFMNRNKSFAHHVPDYDPEPPTAA